MDNLRLRPRFKETSLLSQENLLDRLKEAKLLRKDDFEISHIDNHITIAIAISDRHFWSPVLSLTLETVPAGTLIRGLFGPNPSVWAIFFFGYIALGLIALFSAMVGFSQMMLNMDAPVLYALPASAILGLVLFLVGQTGKNIAKVQMKTLHDLYESLVKDSLIESEFNAD